MRAAVRRTYSQERCTRVAGRRHDLRLDGNQAERCDGNLPFAGRLMALLSMTGRLAGQALKAKSPVGFGLGSSKMLDLSMGID
jgi:hypothetical protein